MAFFVEKSLHEIVTVQSTASFDQVSSYDSSHGTSPTASISAIHSEEDTARDGSKISEIKAEMAAFEETLL